MSLLLLWAMLTVAEGSPEAGAAGRFEQPPEVRAGSSAVRTDDAERHASTG